MLSVLNVCNVSIKPVRINMNKIVITNHRKKLLNMINIYNITITNSILLILSLN